MTLPPRPTSRLLGRGSWRESRYVADILRQETVGGTLLLIAAVAAIVWANSPWREAYSALRDTTVGPQSLHLDLSLGEWAADGLLAVFFLVAGIELKREFVAGDLADRRKAALPIVAAAAGVAVPAILFVITATLVASGDDATQLSGILRGWAIPTATDIAFALAVLAVIGTHLPSALRSFLLTLAVVDDLIAITIIAIFYTQSLNLLWLAAAIVPLAAWRFLLQRKITNPFVLAIPGILAWGFVHSSGIHATVAGVLLGLLVPVNRAIEDDPDRHSLAERIEHKIRPFSAGFAVPVFAFFAAGVTVIGGGFSAALSDPAALGVIVGLVLGKPIGIFGSTWAMSRFTRAELDSGLAWTDVLGLSMLAGVGFTVSLLIGDLAFGLGSERDEHVKFAILFGSLIASLFAAVVLRLRNRVYRRIHEQELRDSDRDGIPDVYDASPGHPD
ncbi:Na+/H+ antiporter NhaA [Intrasporangium calvum]|uniref:Na(+)/H(+) antiporter NhaA n=1 Tax=Intrasporangium calvum (strain ATCC 23552 / DSM 43043 / JCM 3097 / NBRC 12989 / NCIMB 10167 / NRRL B-3866 / 7 KIP) TaxID=710696 RepID=E6S8S6_INTC7|nr:Na+/H+ antiporter NhaA [Intrasporangium calvum]ADU47045.1 sodium/proton antiporter, NhaA family [Intrasporangium calvum DSM 43043]